LYKKISVFRLFCEKAVQERAPSRIYEEKICFGGIPRTYFKDVMSEKIIEIGAV
jgi:hypothetical protein